MTKQHSPAYNFSVSKSRRKSIAVRSNPEQPETPLSNPAEWVYGAFGSMESGTGIRISASLALSLSAWWRGINLIATSLAKTPIVIYRRTGAGKERDTTHPAHYILRRQVNAEMTAFTWKHLMFSHAISHGNGYSYISRLGNGDVEELIPLDPQTTYPVRENGRLFYVASTNGVQRRLNPDQVLHFKGFSPDGLQGYSVIEKAKESLGLGIAGTRHFAKFFSKGSMPSVVFEVPGVLKEETARKMVDTWNNLHSGVDNHFKTALLQGGVTLKPFGFNAKDSQFLEARQFENREIANFLGLPAHKLGDPTRTAYNSLEEENQSFNDDCLDGWMSGGEEEMESKLLRERELRGDTHVIEFERKALVRANLTTRAAYYRAALGGAPWMKQNEVRAIENMNPVEGGDEMKDPLNMGNQGGDDKEPKAPPGATGTPDPNEDDVDADARQRAVTDVIRRMVRRVCTAARQAAKHPETLQDWCERGIEREHSAVIIEACDPIFTLADAAITPHQVVSRIAAAINGHGIHDNFVERLSEIETQLPDLLSREAIGGAYGAQI